MKVEFEVWVDLSCWVFNGCSNGFLLKADYVCHILLSVRQSLMRALDTFLSSESEEFDWHVERFAKSEGGEGGEGG